MVWSRVSGSHEGKASRIHQAKTNWYLAIRREGSVQEWWHQLGYARGGRKEEMNLLESHPKKFAP